MILVSEKESTITTQPDGAIIDYYLAKKASLVFRALNHKLRQQIIKVVHEKSKVTVTELYVYLRLEQSVASQHLAILRRCGIVKTKRDGKCVYYMINYDRIQVIEQCAKDIVN